MREQFFLHLYYLYFQISDNKIFEVSSESCSFEEFKTLVHWAALEGWNPGLQDAAIFWATDPQGFYGYFEGDKLIGGGSIVSYDGQFGFMGFFIVHPDYRAKGLGRTLWQQRRDALLSRLQKDAAIGMDGVVAMQPFYQKGGFTIAYRDERYEKTGSAYPIHPLVQMVTENDFEAMRLFYKTNRDNAFGVGEVRGGIWYSKSGVKE